MRTVVQFAILGLGIGAVYTLLAQGIIVVYRGSGILNFANGAIAMFGAYIFYDAFRSDLGLPTAVALVLAVIVDATLGLFIYWAIMRPLRRASPLARLVATLGILISLEGIATLVWGGQTQYVTSILPQRTWTIDGVDVLAGQLLLLGIAAFSSLALWAAYRYTRLGMATIGAAENPRAASAVGISPDLLASINWALGGALAAIAGVLVAPLIGLDPATMTLLVIAALAAAAVGGFASFPLTLTAGVLIGIIQSEMAFYVHTEGASDAVPFIIIMLVLLVRGQSLPLRSFLADRLPTIGTGRIRWWVAVPLTALVCCLVGYVFSVQWDTAIIVSVASAMVLMSVVVLTGYAGQLSLAPMAFAGLGALFAAQLVIHGTPFLLAILISVVATALLGLLFGIPALRTRCQSSGGHFGSWPHAEPGCICQQQPGWLGGWATGWSSDDLRYQH